MSSVSGGYPDWQRITQWFGTPLATETGKLINAVPYALGPFNARNFASLVICLAPTVQNVTVAIKQQVPAGPASLLVTTTYVVNADNVDFRAIVLLAGAVSVTFTGGGAGTTIDYAIVPSNANTNAEVSTLAQLGFQHNGVVVANETTVDFEDGLGISLAVVDDPGNQRMKVTPSLTHLADATLAVPAASFDFTGIPATFTHLALATYLRADRAAADDIASVRLNGDAGANYNWNAALVTGAPALFGGGVAGDTKAQINEITAATAPANSFGAGYLLIPFYAGATNHKAITGYGFADTGGAPGSLIAGAGGGRWKNVAAVNRVTILPANSVNFAAGSRVTLYGLA